MSPFPDAVVSSMLWKKLNANRDLIHVISQLRSICESISCKISEVHPEFTDHSVKHMDSLWKVADVIFKEDETEKFSLAESFVLACSFYVHDLGMAMTVTEEGRERLRSSEAFVSNFARLRVGNVFDEKTSKLMALKIASRESHAESAINLVNLSIPGLNRYLIEDTDIRTQWGSFIGLVSASHHWSIREVDSRLGSRGKVPVPLGGSIDLGFVACALRIIDYAHINCDRSSTLERMLRSAIGNDSLKHWMAQEFVTGPHREANQLVYGCVRPIADVDAWWTFFELANGLETEIASVNEYLRERTISVKRFSLEGVKGIKTPSSFSNHILTDGFEPIDVRFRPDSMERLITLLGGKNLYGTDHFASIREMLQNSRDAITLQQVCDRISNCDPEQGLISISITTDQDKARLSVSDNGVGMSERVISNYLLGIASDYWRSSDFFVDYPEAMKRGFAPTGRFGIGFLSVFMVGDEVEVRTQRRSGQNLTLWLRGIGRRGTLKKSSPVPRGGTKIEIRIKRESIGDYDNLFGIVRAKAPMLEIPMEVNQNGVINNINPGWWKTASQEDICKFVIDYPLVSFIPERKRTMAEAERFRYYLSRRYYRHEPYLSETSQFDRWPGIQPEIASDDYRIIAVPNMSSVLICSKGFAIDVVGSPGLIGIVDIGDVELNIARSTTIEWDINAFRKKITKLLFPKLLEAMNNIHKETNIPARYDFIAEVAKRYSLELLLETTLPWITVIEPPGNSILVPPKGLKERIAKHGELLIAYGGKLNPWNADRICRSHFPESSKDALIVPVDSSNQPEPGTYRDDDDKAYWGALNDHFFEGPYGKEVVEKERYLNAPLLVAIIHIASKAFHTEVDNMVSAKWVRKKRALCARFLKS